MSFQITQTGPHDSSAGVVQVLHIEGRWAFGVFREWPVIWKSCDAEVIYGPHACSITGVHVEPNPAPFRISDHGCGIYETRDGREAVVRILNDTIHEGRPIRGRIRGNDFDFCWGDDGLNRPSKFDCGSDIVHYIGPLPNPAETWTSTARTQDRVLNRDNGGPIPDGAFWSYRGGESKLVVREQCWVCGDREEWRVPEVRS